MAKIKIVNGKVVNFSDGSIDNNSLIQKTLLNNVGSYTGQNSTNVYKQQAQKAFNDVSNSKIQLTNFLNQNGQNTTANTLRANTLSNRLINSSKDSLNHIVTLQDVERDYQNTLRSNITLKSNLRNAKNQYAKSLYNYNKEKVENEKTSNYDKTIGNITRGIADLLSNIGDSRDVVDNKGNTVRFPSYNELKQNKVSQDYKTGIGKFLGDATYNISKIGASTLANIPTLGIGGSAVYWSDMFLDSYNSAKNGGYDGTSATKYALGNTVLEFITGKMLGSATKGLTGGTSSELSNAISNGINKFISNRTVAGVLGNALSEGTEEFLQEYLDNINKLLTLEGSTSAKDYLNVLIDKDILQDAIYSAGVGALSGGVLDVVNGESKSVSNNTKLFEIFKTQLEETKSTLTDQVQIKKYNDAISQINNYLSKPFGNEKRLKKILPTVEDLVQQERNNKYNSIEENEQLIPTKEDINSINLPTIYSNKIDSKVNEYINSIKNNFESNINISTKDLIDSGINYSHSNQTSIFRKIKERISKFNTNTFRNSQTEENIVVSSRDINKDINATLKNPVQKKLINEHIAVYDNIDKVIENATKITDSIEIKGRDKYSDWNYYVSNVYIDGKEYVVEFDTVYRKDSKNRHFRLKRLYEINKNRDSGGDHPLGTISVSNNNNTPNRTKSQIGIAPLPINGNMQNNSNNTIKLPIRDDINNKNNEINLPPIELNNELSNSNLDMPIDNTSSTKTTPQQRVIQKIQKMLDKRSYRAINIATKDGNKYLDFDRGEKTKFKESLSKYIGKTKEELVNAETYHDIQNIVREYANKEIVYINEDINNIKRNIRSRKIKVTDSLKKQITDYNSFRKENFGNLTLSSSGIGIDILYQELSNNYPYYFSNDINTEADMLYEISEFMKQDTSITEKYRLSDYELSKTADKIYNSLLSNSITGKEIETIQTELESKEERRTRTIIQEELLSEMGINIEDIQYGNDISSIAYQRTDPERLNEKVFGAKIGKKINEATILRTKHNTAEKIRWLNNERNEIKKLGIKARSKESSAVQRYAEKEYIDVDGIKQVYGDTELAREFPDLKMQEKIKNAATVLRNKYDKYIDQINDVITDMGYNPIPQRENYMKHFHELNDKLSQWGIPFNADDMNAEDLPTDINGLTEFNRPGKNWFASSLERTGERTTYDAITGIDKYLEGAGNLIYHTEDIQRYRALSKYIRNTYGKTHGFENLDLLTEKEFIARVKDIQSNKLSKYVAWLDEQANALAGKKGAIDRAAERFLGRKVYTGLNTLKSQVGSNMTGFNVRSSMTNFASTIQAASKTSKLSTVKGIMSTINNMVKNDGLINKSDFLTSRFGSDSLSSKMWQKVSNAGQILMTGSDYFTSNIIWRSKYYEGLSKGLSESESIIQADSFSARIMGDRSQGATAEIFNSKTLGFLTQFQLEVNNQWSNMIHDNKVDMQNGNKSGATVIFQLGQLFAMSYMFNSLMKVLTGSAVMFDPIDMLMKIIGNRDDDKSLEDRATEAIGDFMDNVPMWSIFSGGRIPIQEAFTGVGKLAKKVTGQTDKYGRKYDWGDVGNDFIESLPYWILPTGYGQLKKTYQGLSMYTNDIPGSYTSSGGLRFEADDSPIGKLQSFLFGQYASKNASDWQNSGYNTLTKDDLKKKEKLGLSTEEYKNYQKVKSILNNSEDYATNKLISKINSYDNSKAYTNYVTIYNSEYYKNSKGKWIEVNQNEQKELSKLGMTNTEKNVYFLNKVHANEVYSSKTLDSKEKHNQISDIVLNSNLSEKNMTYLYGKYYSNENTLNMIKNAGISIKEYIKYDTQDFEGEFNEKTGKVVSGSKKSELINFVNRLNLSIPQKALLIKMKYNSYKKYDSQIEKYVNSKNISFLDKATILKKAGFTSYDKQIVTYVNNMKRSAKDKAKILEDMGFTVRNGRVYYK